MLDLGLIGRAIFDGALEGLAQGAIVVEGRAKARAPVRNIFGVEHDFVPSKSIGDVQARRSARGGDVGAAAKMRTQKAPTALKAGGFRSGQQRNLRERRLAVAENLLADYQAKVPTKVMLTRRGASEVKTKRAQYAGSSKVPSDIGASIGGRLRGEIYATRPSAEGNRAEAWVISPTPYARYMEFGTRHNRAYPYLRPAAEESRAEVVGLIADGIREASRTGASSTQIEIVVRL